METSRQGYGKVKEEFKKLFIAVALAFQSSNSDGVGGRCSGMGSQPDGCVDLKHVPHALTSLFIPEPDSPTCI